jgi:gamma-glutamyltranspeptidase/glutathione hydrolase
MGPPSSGGIAVLQTLGILKQFDLKSLGPGSLESVHLIAEALRLAFADRNRYVADTDFVPAPVRGLIDPAYLGERAGLISLDRSVGRAAPGRPSDRRGEMVPRGTGVDSTREIPATSHVSVVDAAGNAVAMTTSIENTFGSRIMVRGFLLNNQMTDFAFRPKDGETPVANRVQRGKRPRSSMSPTIVTDRAGRLVLVLGSSGASRIIPYVVQTLVGVIDWRLDIQRAISLPHFTTSGGSLSLERGTSIVALQPALESRGHTVEVMHLTSGSQGIAVQRRKTGVRYIGGVDPRREGHAIGD